MRWLVEMLMGYRRKAKQAEDEIDALHDINDALDDPRFVKRVRRKWRRR